MEELKIIDGTICHQCYVEHRRGRNWVARVWRDKTAPGGLAREFMKKGSGKHYILLPDLSPGQYIEFGGDYYTASGRPDRNREYYKVLEIKWSAPRQGVLKVEWCDLKDIEPKPPTKAETDIKPGTRLIDLDPVEGKTG